MLYALAIKLLATAAILVFVVAGCGDSQRPDYFWARFRAPSDATPPTNQPELSAAMFPVGMTYEHKVVDAIIAITDNSDPALLGAGIGIDGSYLSVKIEPQEYLNFVVNDTLWELVNETKMIK